MLAFEAALNAVWAMEERALETLLDILARENMPTPEALEAYRAKSLEKAERASVRGGVAIISAEGPMVKRANIFTEISGATSYDILRRDLQAAIDDPKVKSILLNVDSPGGEANGTGELAQAVFEARGQKPIIAYVGGMGASAGYWLASAADKVIVDPSAILGSIGVQMAVREREPAKGEKRYRFVSSNAPNKNPELGTDEAAKQIQEMLDGMEAVFIGAVARNRGVATETVLKNFGRGGIFVGQAAVDAGLADGLGTFESVLAELSVGSGGRKASRKGVSMSDETFTAEQRDAAVTAAVQAEKSRVAGLRKIASGHGSADADLNAAIEGNSTVEAFALAQADKAADARAKAAVEADAKAKVEAEAEAGRIEALQTDEEAAAKAEASKGKEPEADSVEAVVARINAA